MTQQLNRALKDDAPGKDANARAPGDFLCKETLHYLSCIVVVSSTQLVAFDTVSGRWWNKVDETVYLVIWQTN